MSDTSEWGQLINKVKAQESIIALRECARGIVHEMKEVGLDRAEALAYLYMPLGECPGALPLLQLLVKRYWRRVK